MRDGFDLSLEDRQQRHLGSHRGDTGQAPGLYELSGSGLALAHLADLGGHPAPGDSVDLVVPLGRSDDPAPAPTPLLHQAFGLAEFVCDLRHRAFDPEVPIPKEGGERLAALAGLAFPGLSHGQTTYRSFVWVGC